MSNFSTNLTRLLKKHKIRQRILAKEIGVSEAAISYYVRGHKSPRGNNLIAIAQYFDVDCVQLAQGEINE